MKKPKINITITKEDCGYSAHSLIQNISINTQGETLVELKEMVLDVVNLSFVDKGIVYTVDEINYTFDIVSFFDYYNVFNAKALSERIGMNQNQFLQYINGIKKPSALQTQKILNGVQKIGRELAEVRFSM